MSQQLEEVIKIVKPCKVDEFGEVERMIGVISKYLVNGR
jgi:hypothetical protein